MKIYAVGGAIRDSLLGLPVSDIDYVVVGSSPEEMIKLGFAPVGSDFPVFLHPTTKAEYALARTERKTGVGYKGFSFHASPEVTLEEDLARRDLTINAMARELGSNGEIIGPIIDPYGGQSDLHKKLFRHVSDAFIEDPLRVLRVARFGSRFPEFEVADQTKSLLKQIVLNGELKDLVPERVWQEISRGLLSSRPSRMLIILRECLAIKDLFPEDLVSEFVFSRTCSDIDAASQADLNLESRFAAMMNWIDFEQAQAWYEQMRIPLDCRSYADIFRIWRNHYLKLDKLSAENYLEWFDRADAWRKPDRLEDLFKLADILGIQTNHWRVALEEARLVNGGEIAKNLIGQSGEIIGREINLARLKAIDSVL